MSNERHPAVRANRQSHLVAPRRIVEPVLEAGGFQHSYTYAGNPLACAAGLAVLREIVTQNLVDNAARWARRSAGAWKAPKPTSHSSAMCAARACFSPWNWSSTARAGRSCRPS